MTENLFTPDCIRTFSGQYVNVLAPHPDTITIEDIAHSLSMQVRFGGHLAVPYTVAEHSLRVVQTVQAKNLIIEEVSITPNGIEPGYSSKTSKELCLQALMHDASEAYLLDFPTPVKKKMPQYYKAEEKLMKTIAAKFGFAWPMNPAVKQADEEMLQIEWDSFMIGDCNCYLTQRQAKELFLQAFKKYTK